MTETGATQPVLDMRLSDDGRAIALTRDRISDSDWQSIAVMVAETLPKAGLPLLVGADQIVGRAHTLQQILGRIGARLHTDGTVRSLLGRLREDKKAVTSLLAATPPPRIAPEPADGAHRLTRTLRD